MSGGRGHYGGDVGVSSRVEVMIWDEVARILAVLKPFFLWPVIAAFALTTHLAFAGYFGVFLAYLSCGAIGGFFALYYSHHEDFVSRFHGAISVWLVAALMCYVTLAGFTKVSEFALGMGVPLLCLSWSLRSFKAAAERHRQHALSGVFDEAGVGPATMKLKRDGSRLTGKVFLRPGHRSPSQLIRKTEFIEGGAKLPPGSMTFTPNKDDGSVADVVISDPRLLKEIKPWPGPLFPGSASVAQPIRPGKWQDDLDAVWTIVSQHFQIMGMTGSGKSIGACWSTIADLITRHDAAILAADVTKEGQTFGPLEPALHRYESTKAGAKQMLKDVEAIRRERTAFLTEKGLQKWAEGCGLTYMIVWLEECPDIIDALTQAEQERFFASLKAARSAGITYVFSLQRSDWSQLPTIARGQLAKWCFGVADITDAAFGLTRAQRNRECHPEEWMARYPGMAFIDAPGVPEDRISMPMRTWYWGEDDSIIRAHAEAHPAEARKTDAITARALVAPAPQEPAPAEKPQIALPAPKTPRTQLKILLQEHMTERGLARYRVSDLLPWAQSHGKSRGWLYTILGELCDAGVCRVETDDQGGKAWVPLNAGATHLARARKFHANSKRRAQQIGTKIDPALTPEQIVPLYEAEACAYCGERIDGDRQIDHRTPLSRGGAHALDNLVACCRFCNDSKGDKTASEFMPRGVRSDV